ncbi:hypothetical protein B0H10DRAFT_1806089 [Mycena sp. CBHHK59/15]|nr:hypothetical protein B0H10DRAFT_1806089 [Mycena sp. CBHHK59/15]
MYPESYHETICLDFACVRKANILNCAVVGKDLCPYFHVVTNADFFPGCTVFRTNEGRNIALVEWLQNGAGAYVELYNRLEKQLVSAWLGVSRDASHRIMHANGQTYIWVPQTHSICLYRWDPVNMVDVPQLLARVTKEDDMVTLEISLAAIELNLLEMCVVSTVLFQSGCQID